MTGTIGAKISIAQDGLDCKSFFKNNFLFLAAHLLPEYNGVKEVDFY